MTASSAATFDAGALGARYAILDALPEALYQVAVTSAQGELLQRVQGILAWREALLRGVLPEPLPDGWPPAEVAKILTDTLVATQILRFTRGEESVVDQVLLDILNSSELLTGLEKMLSETILSNLLAAEKARRDIEARARKIEKRNRGPVEEVNLPQLRREAALQARQQAADHVARASSAAWAERVRVWIAIEDVFGPLSNLLGLGWDLSRSVLRSTGWLAAEKLRSLLQKLPALKQVIESLGRLSSPPDSKSKSFLEAIIGPLVRPVEVRVPERTPDIPVEMKGVERSDSIARMLPSEAVLLTHPILRYVWHARRAERALLTYEAEGIEFRTVLVDQESMGPGPREGTAHEKGPMILCVDTSGSMAGAPETVAKAVALEALRVANAEKRRLLVYLFSGPGDVEEREIALTPLGIGGLLDFLGCSFHGGTDVAGPLRKAMEKVAENDWRNADVLLVSDGEFPEDAALFERVSDTKETQGLRIQGLLVASEASHAMERICEPLHRFTDWTRLNEGAR